MNLHRGIFFACLVAGATIAFASAASAAPSESMMAAPAPVVVMPDSVKWEPVKGMAGLQYAVLWGDPTKAGGQYAARYNVPAGFKFPPHTHPMSEQVTVLSGTFLVGVGKTMDMAKMSALPAGSFAEIPANLPHYAMAKTATVLEIHGIGPDVINMIK
jgi:ChrR-like protein with cupin domain